MSPGEFEGCLEAHVASKISISRRPRMHDNVCKAVVEHAVWRDPDAGAGEVVVERGRELLATVTVPTGARTSYYEFEL
jgi:hypothetical protein